MTEPRDDEGGGAEEGVDTPDIEPEPELAEQPDEPADLVEPPREDREDA